MRWQINPITRGTVSLLLLSSVMWAQSSAPPLTAEQRALVFGNPGSVVLKKPVAEIPLEGTDHRGFYKCTYLKVFINGKGPFTFLFDTGSSFNIVSSKVVDSAKLPFWLDRGGVHDAFRVRAQISGVEINDLVLLRDDDYSVDGILGFKAFGDMNILFKILQRRLLVSKEPVPLRDSFELPYDLPHNIPRVPIMVGSKEVPTLLDTGDDAYAWEARSSDLSGATLAHPPRPADTVMQQGQEASTSVSTVLNPVKIGPISIRNAVVGVNDGLPVPDLGIDYLKDFNFEFEPKRMVVVFQPVTAKSGRKIRGNLTPGFSLRFDGNGTIKAVVPGSSPEAQGMKSGDVILEINGRPAYAFDPHAWDLALTAKRLLSVKWRHGAETHSAKFPVIEQR